MNAAPRNAQQLSLYLQFNIMDDVIQVKTKSRDHSHSHVIPHAAAHIPVKQNIYTNGTDHHNCWNAWRKIQKHSRLLVSLFCEIIDENIWKGLFCMNFAKTIFQCVTIIFRLNDIFRLLRKNKKISCFYASSNFREREMLWEHTRAAGKCFHSFFGVIPMKISRVFLVG